MKTLVINLLFILSCLTAFSQKKGTPYVRPIVIGEVHELQSSILGEKRILNIYLPEGYNAKDSLLYPVVYLLDGGTDEDFIHTVGLYQFANFDWVNQAPKSIIVGIVNVDRKRDFTFPTTQVEDKKKWPTTGKSDAFISFIEKELQPFVQTHFKINDTSTIIGQSLGGLLAAEILIKKPQLFDNYIIISPSVWWDDASLLKIPMTLKENANWASKKVYVGVGKEGLTPTEKPHVMEVDANLLVEKFNLDSKGQLKVHFDYLPDLDHATIGHQALMNALKAFSKN